MGDQPTSEAPIYRKVAERDDRPSRTTRYMVVCDEGWRSSIVCEGMYEWSADWLIGVLGHQPYAPDVPF
jgi:hypothetical protein